MDHPQVQSAYSFFTVVSLYIKNPIFPLVSFDELLDQHPRQVAEALDKENIYVWDGNYYSLAVTERLGLEASGGMVPVGSVHYNTVEEIGRFGEALGRIAASVS